MVLYFGRQNFPEGRMYLGLGIDHLDSKLRLAALEEAIPIG